MNKIRQIILHTAVWAAILLFFVFVGSDHGNVTMKTVVIYVYFGLINIGIFYVNYLFLLPRYLTNQKYWAFVVSVLFLIIASAFIKYGLAEYFKEYVLIRENEHLSFYKYFLAAIFTSTFVIVLSSGLKFGSDWFVNEKVKKSLEKEKLTAELAFLKSQINPHFLLNSLNNIYSLAYQQSAKTPEAVLKLSEILRYMLYESNDEKVDLAKEVRYLENFIELQRIRLKDKAFVNFEVICGDSHQMIVPMMLIPFVENAFKHGIANDEAHPINIRLEIKDGKLIFQVKNRKNKQNKDITGGIGLHNIQRRLDLLYKGKYMLDIRDDDEVYYCKLYLDL
ncbi:histidine kinase [Pedobacter sp. HMF7647]|uniref:Histidine kinase n=1 Tax=Hufsiella arboris TaxID=2695275 RepID=A0A7K1YAL4_9SPHI|nr:sensor histidine kinase [Hufsiella arboris]MXV51614.1 histidine kinase [Hufsiella arboris]